MTLRKYVSKNILVHWFLRNLFSVLMKLLSLLDVLDWKYTNYYWDIECQKKLFFKYAYLVFQEQCKKEIRDINKNIHQGYKTCLTLSKILKSSAAHLITKEENKKDWKPFELDIEKQMKTRMKMSGLGPFGDCKHRIIAFKTYRATLSVLIVTSFIITSTLQDSIEEVSYSEDSFLLPKKKTRKTENLLN